MFIVRGSLVSAVFCFILLCIICFVPLCSFSDEADAYLFTARKLFEEGRYFEAVRNFEKASSYKELSPDDMALQSISYVKIQSFTRAKEVLDRAIRLSPNNGIVLIAMGVYYFEQGDFNGAYRYFEKAHKVMPGSIQARKGMASSLVNMGFGDYKVDREKARVFFEKALKLEPDFVPALQNLGIIALEEGEFEKALNYLERAHSVEPENVDVLKILYQIYGVKGDKKKQYNILKKLTSLRPYNPNFWALYGRFLEEMGESDKGLDAFRRARELDSDDPYPYLRLAEYYLVLKNREKALYCIRESIGKSAYLIGQLQLEAAGKLRENRERLTKRDIIEIKRIAESIEEPKKLLDDSLRLLRRISKDNSEYESEIHGLVERYPHTLELQVALGNYYEGLKDWDSAIRIWRGIIKKHPRNIDAVKGLGLAYKMKGLVDRAIYQYRVALDIDSHDKTVYEYLIGLHAEKGILEELYMEWEERLYLEPRNSILIREVAKLEMMLGMPDKAKSHMLRAEKVEEENARYEEKKRMKER